MYEIDQFDDEGLKVYQLKNQESQSYIRVVPERGGIITQFAIKGQEILYLNRDTLLNKEANIRGGIPILFPISGQLRAGEYELNGRTYKMNNHGFARNLPWEVIDTSTEKELSITLRLISNEETRKSYPYDFVIVYKYILKNDTLIIEQVYTNQSKDDMPFYAGFHPYFNTSHKIIPLETDAHTYLDYNDGEVKEFTGSIDLSDKKESLMLLDTSKKEISFTIEELKKRVKLEYGNEFKYIVCWTEIGKDFVCIEPWMAQTFEFHQKEELVYVKPGESLKTYFSIQVE